MTGTMSDRSGARWSDGCRLRRGGEGAGVGVSVGVCRNPDGGLSRRLLLWRLTTTTPNDDDDDDNGDDGSGGHGK